MHARSSARRSACTRRDDATSFRSAELPACSQQGRLRAALPSMDPPQRQASPATEPYGRRHGAMASAPRIRIGIVGGTGYTGVELLRLLALHPNAELVAITSRQEAGTG